MQQITNPDIDQLPPAEGVLGKTNIIFPVEWREFFKSLTVYISASTIGPVVAIVGFRYISTGFDYETTFDHLPFPAFLIVLAGLPLVAVVFSFLVATWVRCAAITITDDEIQGRNYWGWKNRIPLSDITALTPFSVEGIDAIVVNSRYHGQIYISDKTQHLPQLIDFLEKHLPEGEKQNYT